MWDGELLLRSEWVGCDRGLGDRYGFEAVEESG
jgi:hypothetical protein